jgi:pimeloyl-ACP methyl ester carboxylesterase
MTKTEKVAAQSKFDELQYPYKMQNMVVGDSITIAYADEGSKDLETILFIHGLGSYAPSWRYTVQTISNNFRCIMVDLPGYGKSSKGKYEADMTFHANHLFELMEKLGIEAFHIAGHSMGGQIAMQMALSDQNKVKSLLLMAPAGIETFTDNEKALFKTTSTPEVIASVSDEQYKTNLALNFYKIDERAQFMYDDRMLIKTDPQFMDYAYVVSNGIMGMLNEPVYEKLQEIKQPTLIVYGKQDQLIPNRYLHPTLTTKQVGELARENIPNATLKMVDKAGHFVHFDQHEEVNTILTNFLNSL